MSAPVTEAHRALFKKVANWHTPTDVACQAIADSEARAVSEWKNALDFRDATISSLLAQRDWFQTEITRLTQMTEAYLAAGVIWNGKWVNHRAETAEAELAKERARLTHLFHHESPMAEPGDTFTEWCADIDAATSTRTHTHNSP